MSVLPVCDPCLCLTRFCQQLLPCNKNGLETLCTSLWAAQDARLLPAPTNFAPSAFYNLVGTILDCIVLLNIRSSKGAIDAAGDASASGDMEDAVAAQVGRVWSEGVIAEASKVVRMTRMIGAEKNTDFYKMATSVGSTVSRLEKVTPSRSQCSTFRLTAYSAGFPALSGTADKALDEITRFTTIAFSPADHGERSTPPTSSLVPRLQLLLEALEEGYSGDESRIRAFTDRTSLQVASQAVQHIKQSLGANDSMDKLAKEDYPKMLAHLLEKRGTYLMRDETFSNVSTYGFWGRILTLILSLPV